LVVEIKNIAKVQKRERKEKTCKRGKNVLDKRITNNKEKKNE
jgi:hypothetical protein